MERCGGLRCSSARAASQQLRVPRGFGIWGLFQYEGPQMTVGKKQIQNAFAQCAFKLLGDHPGCPGFSGSIPV